MSSSYTYAATCSASVSSAAITSNQHSYTGATTVYAFQAVAGPVSKCMYFVNSAEGTKRDGIVRKYNTDDTLSWMAALLIHVSIRGVVIDSSEQNVYIATNNNPFIVIRLRTSDGVIVDAQSHTSFKGSNEDITVHVFSDNSGYIAFGSDSSNKVTACKYLYTSSNSQCHVITEVLNYALGQLKLSDTQFFFVGSDITSPYSLHYLKLTFGSLSTDWASKMLCPTGTCSFGQCYSLLSQDSAKIYSFVGYGSTRNLWFTSFLVSDGSVSGSRYKSSVSCDYSQGGIMTGNYAIAPVSCSPNSYLVIFDTSTSTFTMKQFSLGIMSDLKIEPTTGRLVLTALVSSNGYGYISKFMLESLDAHPDFLASTAFTMDAITAGTNDLTSETLTIEAVSTMSIASTTYTNDSVTYIAGTSYTSDVYFLTSTQTYSIDQNLNSQVTPSLPCSYSGSTAITYSIANYLVTAPTWVSISSSTGVLTVSPPTVSSTTAFSFYVSSTITDVTNPINKIVTITVNACSVANCQVCSTSSISVCATCSSGFTEISGSCTDIHNTVYTLDIRLNNG